MVYDKIDSIETYKGLSEDIYEGLKLIKNATLDLDNGVHEINPRVKAIVSEYETKTVNENGYEAHRMFIDIQYLLKGTEKICYLPVEYLKERKAYRSEIEAAFFEEVEVNPLEIIIGNRYFAIFFPRDGHMPCLSISDSLAVKKVVIKVAVVNNV